MNLQEKEIIKQLVDSIFISVTQKLNSSETKDVQQSIDPTTSSFALHTRDPEPCTQPHPFSAEFPTLGQSSCKSGKCVLDGWEQFCGREWKQEQEQELELEQEGGFSGGVEEEVERCNDLTCAICLEQMNLEDIATIKQCGHIYCVHCIVAWAKVDSRCPQCKTSFETLCVQRMLDGTLLDYAMEENVVMLRRASWVIEKMPHGAEHFIPAQIPQNEDYYGDDYYDYDYHDEDEEIEDFYYSSAAGRARIVLGNRRLGENGYVRSGRQHAIPTQASSSSAPKRNKGGSKKGNRDMTLEGLVKPPSQNNNNNNNNNNKKGQAHQMSSAPTIVGAAYASTPTSTPNNKGGKRSRNRRKR